MPDSGDPPGGEDRPDDRRDRDHPDREPGSNGGSGDTRDRSEGTAGERSDERGEASSDEPASDRRPRAHGPDPADDGDDAPNRRDRTPRRDDPPDPAPGTGADDDGGWRTFLREIGSTVGAVVVVGLVLFAVSGVWPPLVAVESGSMEPHMYKGDLVFIVENGRFATPNATDGVVTYRTGRGSGYWSFGNYGNVVVYRPHVKVGVDQYRATDGPPIIHRAQFFVEENEDWVAMANDRYLGSVDSCSEVDNCPAPHDGFITKGDNNGVYDQVTSRSTVVKEEWIRGVAKVRIPWLGCVRLQLSGDTCF